MQAGSLLAKLCTDLGRLTRTASMLTQPCYPAVLHEDYHPDIQGQNSVSSLPPIPYCSLK